MSRPPRSAAHQARQREHDDPDFAARLDALNPSNDDAIVPPMLAALRSAGIAWEKLSDGLYSICRVGVGTILTVSTRSGAYVVRCKNGPRWRTLGAWKRPARVVREVQGWASA